MFFFVVNNTATIVDIRSQLVWSGVHQEHMLIKVSRCEKYAYGFGDSFVFSFDINENRIIQLEDISTRWKIPIKMRDVQGLRIRNFFPVLLQFQQC